MPAQGIITSSKTLHHTSQAMAGAHIASVKFNACMCAWAGPSRSGGDLKSFAAHDSGPGRNDPETFQSSDLRLS